jgi:hypothetical protein
MPVVELRGIAGDADRTPILGLRRHRALRTPSPAAAAAAANVSIGGVA